MHTLAKRATPNEFMMYRHALLLHRTFNDRQMRKDWVDLHFSQVFNRRNANFQVVETNRFKIGKNKLCNRFKVLNNLVTLDCLNDNFAQFKIKMKLMFLLKK